MNKLMIIYIVGGLIPLLLVSFVLTGTMRRNLVEQATFVARTDNERIGERLTEVISTAKDVSDGIYLDDHLQKIITTEYRSTIDVINELNNYSRIDEYLQVYEEISAIRIYVENTTLLDNSQTIKITDEIKMNNWYQKALEADGKMILVDKFDEIQRENVLSLLRMMKNKQGEFLGVSAVNISTNYLNKIVTSDNLMLIILDSQSLLIANNPIENIGDMNLLAEDIMPVGEEIKIYDYYDKKYNVISKKLHISSMPNEFQIISLVSLANLNAVADKSLLYSVLLITISSVISIIMVYLFSRAFSNRVNSFRRDMHQVAEGNFDAHPRVTGKDEIGSLSVDLETMITNIQTLIHEVYEEKIQKEQLSNRQKDVQFKMLASQINPHFLYNALETIRMKALINQQREIASVVKKLAIIMRRNLSVSNEEVTLKSEIALIKNYLEIQQFRFGEKVSFSIHISYPIDDYMILPLLLQPLIENAFVHGLEKKIGEGYIHIVIEEIQGKLAIKVIDNGVGVEPEKLSKIWDMLKSDVTSIDGSIGLANVNQRLKIYYGEEYQIQIESNHNYGTEVTIYLPIDSRGDNRV